jgi:hypothetical protein
MLQLALSQPTVYAQLRKDVLQLVKKDAVNTQYSIYYNLLTKGKKPDGTHILGTSGLKDLFVPHVPNQIVNEFALKASKTIDRIAEEASISENMGDRKPANIFAYQFVNEQESGYDESDLPERSKGIYTPVNAAMHRYRTIHSDTFTSMNFLIHACPKATVNTDEFQTPLHLFFFAPILMSNTHIFSCLTSLSYSLNEVASTLRFPMPLHATTDSNISVPPSLGPGGEISKTNTR